MADKIRIRRGNKAQLPALDDGEFGLSEDTKELFLGTTGGNIALPNKTYTNLTYYVDAINGNDANDGLAAGAGRALKTIMAAVSKLPQVINHNSSINVADGAYNEDVVVEGYFCSPLSGFTLNGNATTPANVSVKSITFRHCTGQTKAVGFTATSTTTNGFTSTRCSHTIFDKCVCTAATAGQDAFYFDGSQGRVTNSTGSNRRNGIGADFVSCVYSSTNTGTGNAWGLNANAASTIGKQGSQPAGTTAETATNGGVIR